MSNWPNNIIALVIWPGLLGATLLSWFLLWLERKLIAKMQGRKGPPFYQPFFDFFKLLSKNTVVPEGVNYIFFYTIPFISVLSVIFALALIPVPGNRISNFTGDLIVLIYLLEMPAISDILAGYISRSIYGQVGSARGAVLMLSYNIPFLGGIVALALSTGSFKLNDLSAATFGPVHIAAAFCFLLAIPARLQVNPFSIANAKQEIVDGVQIEYSGYLLAVFKLAHGLELVALSNLFYVLIIPPIANPLVATLIYLLTIIIIVFLTSFISAATARLKIHQGFRFYWIFGAIVSIVAIVLALLW